MLRILLADDSMTAQNMGKKILTDAGFDVITVSNGAAALKKIPEVKPDLVLLDIYMPGYNGLEVCEQLKNDPETEHIPVLLTVGKLEPFRPEDGMRVKAEGVVIKPFEATDLLTVVNKMAERVPPPAPVQPIVIQPIAIPDYSFGDVEPSPVPEQKLDIPWEAAAMPALGDDLLPAPSEPLVPHLPSPELSAQSVASSVAAPAFASDFSDFEIELEPLPLEPQLPQGNVPEFPQAHASAMAAQGDAFPIEFELDDSLATLPGSEAQPPSALFEPLAPEMPNAPPQSDFPCMPEAAALHIATDGAKQPEPMAAFDSADNGVLVDDLSRTLQEALACVEEPHSPAAPATPEEEVMTQYDLDVAAGRAEHSASRGALSGPPTATFQHGEAHEIPVHELHRPVVPEELGAVIDLDSILGGPSTLASSEAETAEIAAAAGSMFETPAPLRVTPELETAEADNVPASASAVPEEAVEPGPPASAPVPTVQLEVPEDVPASAEETGAEPAPSGPSASADTGAEFDVDQAIAEQVAERVLQRLRPQLIEEIRNVLKDM